MGIKKYFASKDNTLTNAFKNNLLTRGTGSNMGAADILEAFVIHGQTSASLTEAPSAGNASAAEQSRFIIQFPISNISSDMAAGILPNNSGSLKFHLNLYNAPHGSSTPLDFTLDLKMLSQSWTEGRGLDMDNYTDLGVSNWISSSVGSSWSQQGGSYLAGSKTSASISFPTGLENVSLDVTDQVYKWLGATNNYGFMLKFPDSSVSGSESLYTKKFLVAQVNFIFTAPLLKLAGILPAETTEVIFI